MASTFVPLVPRNLGHPPVQWSAAEVKAWLKFCVEEFSLSPICTTRFDMNGKALCLLTRTDFIERAPHAGDVLHNVFQKLRQQDGTQLVCHPQFHTGVLLSNSGSAHTSPPGRQTFVPILPQPSRLSSTSSTTSITATSTTTENCSSNNSLVRPDVCVSANSDDLQCTPTNMLRPAPSERSPSDTSDSSYLQDRGTPCPNTTEPDVDLDIKPDGVSCPSPLKEDGASSGEGGCRLLWEFVYQLLQDPRYAHLVCWESESDLTFRINNQAGLADLWGQQKNKDNMTYEKLSRALRYYYKMNIIKKVQARRLTYKFLQHPTKIKRGQRGARPHASRVAAEQQGDVAPHVTSSSAPGLHGDSPGYEEGEEDTKALNVTLVETVADSTGSAQSFTTSENSYSVVTFSGVASSCSAHVCVESPSPKLSIEPPLSLPALHSSSISVGSNISTVAGDIPSPLLSTTPLSLAGNSIASGTPEGNNSNLYSAASIHLEKEPDPRVSLAADTTFDSRLQQDSVACHSVTEQQQEQENIHITFLKIDERSDGTAHIPENQHCVENSGPEATRFPYEVIKCTSNTSSSSLVEDDEIKLNQHEEDYSIEQNQNPDGIRDKYRESGSSHQLLRSPEQMESCPSPLVYTELTPKQNTNVSKSQSLQISPSYPVTESFGSTLVQLVQHNSTDRIQDLELGQNESQQPLFQAHAISNSHLLSFGTTRTRQLDAYHYRPLLQHNEVSVMLPTPSTPYLKSYQRQEVHENGNDLDCRSEFSIDRKFSPGPAIPTSSYSHIQSEPTLQLHVSVSKHPLSEKRKADELVELCNTYPAHQKRQCLAGRTASPSITQYFPNCHSIHHRHSPARPASQPEFRQSVLPLAHAHSSHEKDRNVSFTDWAMPEFGARDHRKLQSYEFENRYGLYGPSSLEVMDLSKPNQLVKFELEQEQPEDLSMKAKAIPAIL